MSAKCSHGYTPSNRGGHTFSGGDERKIDRHERKCRRAAFVAHKGWLGWTVCCAGCKAKIL